MAEHDNLSHDGSDGSKFNERIERAGYSGRRVGENIAGGQKSVEEAMRTWMESPHHRENILGDFGEIGVARAESADGTAYWCANFGLPRTRLDREAAVTGVVDALNRAREKAGRPRLKPSGKLSKIAQSVAEELARLGDLRKGETTYAAQVRQGGYRYRLLGEAAASGQSLPDQVAEDWLDNPVHRENLLGKFSEIGVGYATTEKGIPFWVVFVAQPAK
jgi:uncharacterized protein YkwD